MCRSAPTGASSDPAACRATVVFPDNRNVHGKAFGGFVMGSAYDLAYLAARYFTRGQPFVPVGFDDAIFVQPVAIGDMVRFTAKVVHFGEDGVFRVFVTMDVIEPTDPGRLPRRTNKLMFVFAASPACRRIVLPTTYSEVLMHVMAARNHAARGLSPTVRTDLAEFFCETGAPPPGTGGWASEQGGELERMRREDRADWLFETDS